jgi:predicted site-specific integrase-resolvase
MTKTCTAGWISATAAARRLGVSSRALRRHAAEGKLPDVRGAAGRRIFRVREPGALTGKRDGGKAAGYARVCSRRRQAGGDLSRQAGRLRACAGNDLTVCTDVSRRLRAAVAAGVRSPQAAGAA